MAHWRPPPMPQQLPCGRGHPIDNVARGWHLDPALSHRSADRARMSAALWQVGDDELQVVKADPDPLTHLVTFTLDSMVAEMSFEDRLSWRGDTGRGGLCIVSAGREPKCAFRGAHRNLHLNVPSRIVDEIASGELGREQRGIELVDPQCRQIDHATLGCALRVLDELREPQPLMAFRLDLLGQKLGIHLLRRHAAHAGLAGRRQADFPSDWRLALVVSAIRDDLTSDWTLDALATIAGLTPRHVSTLFKIAYGVSPHRWIVEARLDRARHLLAETERSVTEIAMDTGFATSQHFATMFRRAFGTTLGAYRRDRG